ncbi:hypothetical protein LH47_00597 [Anoxybacillus thermarum]|uniref:DUF421 domain-containing protein n=1 Tax=Anoxybacillus thermarum TaxID=404937 RepID=A0A0D0QB91_9BACL|nr:DUF421 domain-containing protein [Anoxybacillus thermarum]KIQ95343.1 hypothetical protein LH47_00597 [Anoxybacillus thermarum]
MSEFRQIAIELVVGYIALFIMAKILGRTQITQITPFDFISALVLGELVGNGLYDSEVGLSKVLFAIGLWGLLIYTTEMITQKKKELRELLEGKPVIVISKGKILYEALKQTKLDLNQLQHLLRARNVFSVREVEYAILETDGTVSVMKKAPFEQPTRQDQNISACEATLPVTVIIDGEVIWDNLQENGWDEQWLKKHIRHAGFENYNDILYAEWQDGKGMHVQAY